MHDATQTRSPLPRAGRRALVAAGLAALLLAGACSKSDDASVTSTSVKTDDAPGTTAKRPGTTVRSTEGTAGKSTTADDDQSDRDPWDRSAEPYRGQIGEEVEFECPAGGEAAPVWGTNLYTDDSSVCTAAVHVGLITFEDGGTVTILIEEGADEYLPSSSNDVETNRYSTWPGSFSFPDADPVEAEATVDWGKNATSFGGTTGDEITVVCEADGTAGSVWGTDTYTDDSSVCTAAVHAGIIDLDTGGEITFQLVAGLDAYTGSTANGVTSQDYGSWSGSFVFVEG